MSPRRVALKRLAIVVVLATTVLAGCIFDPKPADKPPPCENCVEIPTTPVELIAKLQEAYQLRSYDVFANLFPTAEDNAPYLFILSEPLPGGQTNWDVTEELRIHRRMFQPENPLPGETPVPQDLWLAGITITLTPLRDFSERTDLYGPPVNPNNPQGLDPAKWKATEAEYHADILFDTQTDTDYRVNGRTNFVVIEDLTKTTGDNRKFLIYRWEDLGSFAKPTEGAVPAI
jgi:hypothetical protein